MNTKEEQYLDEITMLRSAGSGNTYLMLLLICRILVDMLACLRSKDHIRELGEREMALYGGSFEIAINDVEYLIIYWYRGKKQITATALIAPNKGQSKTIIVKKWVQNDGDKTKIVARINRWLKKQSELNGGGKDFLKNE